MTVKRIQLCSVLLAFILIGSLFATAVLMPAQAETAEDNLWTEINVFRQAKGHEPFAYNPEASEAVASFMEFGGNLAGWMVNKEVGYDQAVGLQVHTADPERVWLVLRRMARSQLLSTDYQQMGVIFGEDRTIMVLLGFQPGEASSAALQSGLAEDELSAQEIGVVQRVNEERSRYDLAPLQIDLELTNLARLKSADMRDLDYFAHDSPTYGSPFQMMSDFGVIYRAAGENLAAGQPCPDSVVQDWMDSPGHRENILDSNYTHIGVGYKTGGTYGHYWSQLFTGL